MTAAVTDSVMWSHAALYLTAELTEWVVLGDGSRRRGLFWLFCWSLSGKKLNTSIVSLVSAHFDMILLFAGDYLLCLPFKNQMNHWFCWIISCCHEERLYSESTIVSSLLCVWTDSTTCLSEEETDTDAALKPNNKTERLSLWFRVKSKRR